MATAAEKPFNYDLIDYYLRVGMDISCVKEGKDMTTREIIMELDRLLGERSESYNIQEEMEATVVEEEVDKLLRAAMVEQNPDIGG